MQLRLAIVQPPAGATCQIAKRGDDEDRCLRTITSPCVHPHKCKAGPARLRPHRAVMMSIKKILVKSGAGVDTERAIPQPYRVAPDGVVKEAILDVVVISPGCLQTYPVDVTIRCPHGLESASSRPAVAAKDGELEKCSRYDASVTPISLETYGRLGVASMAGLRQLALAMDPASTLGSFQSPRDLLAISGGIAVGNRKKLALENCGHDAALLWPLFWRQCGNETSSR